MEYKYIAYYAATEEFELCLNYDEAELWLKEYDNQDGYSKDSAKGLNFIAKITHKSFLETAPGENNIGRIKYKPVDE